MGYFEFMFYRAYDGDFSWLPRPFCRDDFIYYAPLDRVKVLSFLWLNWRYHIRWTLG